MKKLLILSALLIFAFGFGQDIELNGTVSAENNQIKNVADPTDDQDAATKAYADNLISSFGYQQWSDNQVWNDNTTISPEPNSFWFINAENPTITLPSQANQGDVIKIYYMGAGINNFSEDGHTVFIDAETNGIFMGFESADPNNYYADGFVYNFGGVKPFKLKYGLNEIIQIGDYWMLGEIEARYFDFDFDNDGFSSNAGDCNDFDAANYPPLIPNQEITICSGESFVFNPVNDSLNTLVPEGTTYNWTATDTFNEILGESSSEGNNQSQISQTLTNPGGEFYGILYDVTPYSPSGCAGQTFELIVYVSLPIGLQPINDMDLMNGESDNFEFYSSLQNQDVIYYWVSDVEFGAGLSGVGNTSFTAINSSSIPIIANVTVTATLTNNGRTCVSPPETFTVTVNPAG